MYLDRVAGDIAGGAEEHGVAERQQSAVADQQIERAGEQRKAQRLHDEVRIDAGPRQRDEHQRHHRERDQLIACGDCAGDADVGVFGDAGHRQAALPVNPVGLTSSTSTMNTNTTVFDASG